ncbi:MAG TPA: formate--tetrahydrofolate ligase [Saprospiraceae bacterium]|nr:formate--tetrahydrofolate ligase [Saprospiraceae bacterium]HQW56938.1 formate--tetrahydrofolate ligase [Saprospiraceae bacterium]
METDLSIAQRAELVHIKEIADQLKINEDDLVYYGRYKAKIPLTYIDEEKVKKSKLILVSAMSPTPAGEGKTTCSIGIAQALCRNGKKATVVLREPSLGPVFGIKGGAAGGGYSQVLPMEDINMHFTGDFAAIEKANNLLAAMIDNNVQNKKNNIGINPQTVIWKRVMDMNDRSLRNIVSGLGGKGNGVPREAGFNITAASEVMAILCLSNNRSELKEKLGNIYIGNTYDGAPVYARDLKAHGAMAALLKDAFLPNLVQTIEHTPAIIHGGPFANIAQGTNTLVATKMGLSLSDYVVTEAGFGFDLGGEKFIDIKCRVGHIVPSCVVIIATIRALKYHGGVDLKELKTENVEAVKKGYANLSRHIENSKHYGIPAVVAINKFVTDTDDEIQMVKDLCEKDGSVAEAIEIWAKGGAGAQHLATKITDIIDGNPDQKFQPLYELEDSTEEKIKKIAQKIYRASDVEYSAQAKNDLKLIKKLKLTHLPVCIAKTQKSFSDNPNIIGAPNGFTITVREIEIAAGAGFVVPVTGEMMRMPGLPETPSAEHIDIDEDGTITGLF